MPREALLQSTRWNWGVSLVFFTTKETGRGTGLGLPVSKGIAETHGGQLTHERVDRETRFSLTLRRLSWADQDRRPSGDRGTYPQQPQADQNSRNSG